MAKDTEKLIRQLSLISFLMAKRRPVTALEIKRDVEGYSEMNDDAFARRFYADRAELEALGIELRVDRAVDGFYEAENYSLPPENFYLPSVQFTDRELASLTTALKMLDGQFAYAEPLRLALQQLTWGRPSPFSAPDEMSIHVAVGPDVEGRELSQRLSKIENAIFRRKTIIFEYFTIGRGSTEKRKVDPFHLLYRGGEFYMIGHAHEREEQRMFKLSRIRGKISYASKAEHDFPPPEDFDPREYATMAEWQFGQQSQTASIWISERIAWLVERHFSKAGRIRTPKRGEAVPGKGVIFETEFTDTAPLISWVLGHGPRARVLEPSSVANDVAKRVARIARQHTGEFEIAPKIARRRGPSSSVSNDANETSIKPERFARLITLAGILIGATHTGATVSMSKLATDLNVSREEIEEDIEVLNVVNFGGGSYVLFAQIEDDEISVDSEPYSDNFARPARLLPLEAKALIAAIDLLGEYFPNDSLLSARKKVVTALGEDPATSGLQIAATQVNDSEIATAISQAIQGNLLVQIEHYKEDQDTFTQRTIEPYSLMNGREGWYVHTWDLSREAPRDFRLDRIKSIEVQNETFKPRDGMVPDLDGWPRTGTVGASTVAKIWIDPEHAPRAREEYEPSLELKDGAILIELPYGGVNWLVTEVFKFAGDAVVLEPADAREAVRDAAKALKAEIAGGGVKAAAAKPSSGSKREPVTTG